MCAKRIDKHTKREKNQQLTTYTNTDIQLMEMDFLFSCVFCLFHLCDEVFTMRRVYKSYQLRKTKKNAIQNSCSLLKRTSPLMLLSLSKHELNE